MKATPNISLYHCDNLELMATMPDESVDVILTDPPYLYLKNQKLERVFDEQKFFSECNRVLTKDGALVVFGRGTSFYRWNTIIADLGFEFKEEIVWDKCYITSPLSKIGRHHETVSIHFKGKGIINKVKVPYLEMKQYDIRSVIQDVNRLKSVFKNTSSLNAVLAFLEDDQLRKTDKSNANFVSISSNIGKPNRCVSVANSIKNGMNEKTIIKANESYYNLNATDRQYKEGSVVVRSKKFKSGDRCVGVINGVSTGMNEKSIVKQARNHYKSIHPTEKPVRLLERLLALVIPNDKPTDEIVIFDPFGGSFSTMEAVHNMHMQGISCEIDKEYFDGGHKRIEELEPAQKEIFNINI